MDQVNFVSVPQFEECTPEILIDKFNLKNNTTLLNYFPEIEYKHKPKDRDFFFNILNTLYPHTIEKMVYESVI